MVFPRATSTIDVSDWNATDSSALNDLNTEILANQSEPVRLVFPPGIYNLDAKVNLDLPPGSVVVAEGAEFVCSHDGVGFDLNPAATAELPITVTVDTYTKRNIVWRGGTFTNTNVSKTQSVALQAYFMRVVRFENVRVGSESSADGFYAGWKFGAKDSYRFINCYSYACKRHYWVPAAGVLFTASLTANDLIDANWQGCQLSCSASDEAGIYLENRIVNFAVNGGSINGSPTNAHVVLSDNATAASRDIAFSGVHFETMSADKSAVKFTASGGKGYDGVSFQAGCEFNSGNANWQGVALARCRGVCFGCCIFSDGSTGRAGFGISVDTNSRNVYVGETCRFTSFMDVLDITGCIASPADQIRITSPTHGLQDDDRVVITAVQGTPQANGMWLVTVVDTNTFDLQGSGFGSGTYTANTGEATLLNAIELESDAVRQYVTIAPEVVNLSTPRALTNYQAAAQSSQTTTINMAVEFKDFISTAYPATWLWPKGYDLHLKSNDSGSAGASANTCYVWLKKPSAILYTAVQNELRGVLDDASRSSSGHVPADADGNIEMKVSSTGTDTMDVSIGISGIRQ